MGYDDEMAMFIVNFSGKVHLVRDLFLRVGIEIDD